MKYVLTLGLALLAAVFTLPAQAGDKMHSMIKVEDAWARATAPKAPNGAAYITVHSHGQSMDRLVAAASPVAKKVELHTHLMADGVMKMRRIEGGVEVHPGAPAVFRPGGNHIMLMGLNQQLKPGESFKMTLTFEKAGPIEVEVMVMKAGAMGKKGMKGMDHSKHKMN